MASRLRLTLLLPSDCPDATVDALVKALEPVMKIGGGDVEFGQHVSRWSFREFYTSSGVGSVSWASPDAKEL